METSITLRQGLDRFYEANGAMFSDRDVSPEAQAFFRCHDVAHVVFGCKTTLFGEGVLKLFTIFGTTLGFWRHLSGYAESSAFRLFRQYSVLHVVRNLFWLFLSIPRVIIHAKCMRRPWPWDHYNEYLDRPLAEIRQVFNIVVIPQPQRVTGKV